MTKLSLEEGEMYLSDETQMKHHHIPVHDIPISLMKQESAHGFLDSNIERKHQTLFAEVEQHYVGPISADDFVPTYLPVDHERDGEMAATMTALVAIFSEENTHSKNDVLKNLCDCINSSMKCLNFKLRVPFENIAPSPPSGSSCPDICLYDETSIRPGLQSRNQSSILGCADLFLQYKTDAEMDDPFDDPDPDMDLSCFKFVRALEDDDSDDEDTVEEEEAMFTRNLSEIAAFAAELCAHQFRTHCFSISIYGTIVRFFRWDRAGVVISEAFDICEEPELFCTFIWNYTHATAAQRGYDTSVTMASIEEEAIFAESVRKHVKDQLCIADDQELELDGFVNEHYQPKSVYKMAIYPSPSRGIEPLEVDDIPYGTVPKPYPWEELWREVEKEERAHGSEGPAPGIGGSSLQSKSRVYSQAQYFLVSRPVVTPLKFACRGTRGYWAVKIPDESIGETDHRIAFVKDTWREDSKEADIEGETLVELVEAGVKFVSDIFCHGDVKPQNETDSTEHCVQNCYTQTQKHNKAEWNLNKRKLMPLVHYRMASVEAGYPLSSLRGMKELIHTVRCGYLAAWAAYVLRRRLHRDVSLNNFVLVKKNGKLRTGILIDWELSSRAGKDGKALDSSRSGTWAFLSIAALRQKDFRHEFRDDMESFYYVLLFASVHWLPHDKLENIEKLVSDFFDEQDFFRGIVRGGCHKIANIGLNYFQSLWDFTNTSLRRCLEDIRKLQDSWTDQPDWTPQKFYSILESTDNEDLPQDDRIDHVQTLRAERERRRILADLQYAESFASETDSFKTPSNDSQASFNSKRSAEDAELEECVEPFKRHCCPISASGDRYKTNGTDCQCS